MKLRKLIEQYILFRQGLGEKFITNAIILRGFSKAMGDIELNEVTSKSVENFLIGKGVMASSWYMKLSSLKGFYDYLISRGYTTVCPLPLFGPKKPERFVPYIYSTEEIRRLLIAAISYQKNRGQLDRYMVRTVLLILYGAGLRISEALSLTLWDVRLTRKKSYLMVRETKFYKTRIIPIGPKLRRKLEEYRARRNKKGHSQNREAPFFINRDGTKVNSATFEQAFQRIRIKAKVNRSKEASYQPRLHDLRHTFAVHRLIAWYQQNADIQQLLPLLSTYMGHKYLANTTVYLSMTPELLKEAGHRFELYANGGNKND
jgi:integrase/recombinase XerD